MNNNPFLSIITINYNNAPELEKTLLSVFHQLYTDFEYIVIDGGSTDESLSIIKKHKKQITYYTSEPDTGIFNAMNRGIDVAKGAYLLFLNSGDVLTSSNALSDFINHEKFKGDIIYGDYKFKSGEKIYPDTLYPSYFMRSSLPHQSTLFKKDVFKKMGGYDETYKIISDRAFYLKCFLSDQFQFTHVKYFLTLFDMEGVSNNDDYRKKKIEEDERMFKSEYGVFYEECKRSLFLEQELKKAQRKTLQGILKRIKIKLKKLWVLRHW
ncbi:glycosyltransferase family 2 protein [Flavivirga algicola]|uniref:Glycosyltransferase n=1 Tax=Flavivirga algicola TaxID=2729136 RepID=A0ABX1RS21_9FLAO|nr:glycosyltransferase family 2 protein [Flavivirga algicola]NMH86351.1 glycosyltransferase [Flavivirga algicola]